MGDRTARGPHRQYGIRENGSLYYLSTDANDTISGTQTLKKRDLLTGDVTELCQGAADEFGEMLMANGYGAFFRNITESGSIRLSLRDDETGEETVIQSGVSTTMSRMPRATLFTTASVRQTLTERS